MNLPPLILKDDQVLKLKHPFGIMGIVNITSDSFWAESRVKDPALAVERALLFLQQGANILDLGAESSRPGSKPLDMGLEIEQLEPVIKALKEKAPQAILSVDTWHAATAAQALSLGVQMINDISACRFDPELLEVVSQYKPGYVLMHAQGRPATMQISPKYQDVIGEIFHFFEVELTRLVKAGLPEDHILLDPGIGFGKRLEDNLLILKQLHKFKVWGRPLLVGLSYKSLFGDLLGLPLEDRGSITQVATALLWQQGVGWHRVHEVKKTFESLSFAQHLSKIN
ncbi:MAG: dihydropteroate synthase [Desulfovibrionaceae bacterium]|nr:dihydropteroate synthase [Desulfovibrionaceae bacterium]